MRFMSGNSNTVVGLDVTEKQIDPTLIKAWLGECQAGHAESCSPPPLDDAALRYAAFRLIDVQQLCVVPASVQASYVALSYVWGETTRFSLDRGNRESLMRQDGLLQSWDRIPETIRDAILLLRKMELKYLWVDCLCLVQDDPGDMDGGMQMMDAIFEHSLFTLIAASGTNSNSGLPGVRDGSRSPMQITCDLGSGLRLLLVHQIDELLDKTEYSKRAWTYQERMLSHRRVIFLNNMVYFQCREYAASEDSNGMAAVDFRTKLGSMSHIDEPALESYNMLSNIVSAYTQRQLTHQADVLKAMAGIFRRVRQKTKCDFLQGLPTAAIDLYLLFIRFDESKRRPGFASWSWAGWIGITEYDYGHLQPAGINAWLASDTWIVWYKRTSEEGGAVVELVWDPAKNTAERGDVSYGDSRSSFQQVLARYGLASSLGHLDTLQTEPSGNVAAGSVLPSDYPLLQFWTLVVRYTVERQKRELYGRSGTRCGRVIIDSTESMLVPDAICEFIVLSKVSLHADISFYFYECGADRDAFWALLIKLENGVAERRGLALVYNVHALADSLSPGPEWKEIVLG